MQAQVENSFRCPAQPFTTIVALLNVNLLSKANNLHSTGHAVAVQLSRFL